MLLDANLFNTQHYKVWIKDKVEQSSVVATEKVAFGSPLTEVANFFTYNVFILAIALGMSSRWHSVSAQSWLM